MFRRKFAKKSSKPALFKKQDNANENDSDTDTISDSSEISEAEAYADLLQQQPHHQEAPKPQLFIPNFKYPPLRQDPAQQSENSKDEKALTEVMLESLGFDKFLIAIAIQMYEKNYGTDTYNMDTITEIIVRLQNKQPAPQRKSKKKDPLYHSFFSQLLKDKKSANNNSNSNAPERKRRGKSKHSSAIHRGDEVKYRATFDAEVLEKMGEYLQISWPVTKPLYQRAVLWVPLSAVEKKEVATSEPKKSKKSMMWGLNKLKGFDYEKAWHELIIASANVKSIDKNDPRPRLHEMEPTSMQYVSMKAEFARNCPEKYCSLVNVYAVNNPQIMAAHNARKNRILKFSLGNDSDKLNEHSLWYSATQQQIPEIVAKGFKRSSRANSPWGNGHVFVRNSASACRSPGCVPDAQYLQYLVYCSVVCGESCVGDSMMKMPPSKPGQMFTMYDTSVDHEENASLYVTYQQHQARPLYVLVVKRKRRRHHKHSERERYAAGSERDRERRTKRERAKMRHTQLKLLAQHLQRQRAENQRGQEQGLPPLPPIPMLPQPPAAFDDLQMPHQLRLINPMQPGIDNNNAQAQNQQQQQQQNQVEYENPFAEFDL